MARSQISSRANLSSSMHERRQLQTRIRTLQQRTNTLYDELSHSSSLTKKAVQDIERTYVTITNEFREQRQQLLKRLQNVKQNIKTTTNELDTVRKSLNTAQSIRLPHTSPRYTIDAEVHEINHMIDDIEHGLNNIAHQLKQVRFIPGNDHVIGKTLGTIRIKDNHNHQHYQETESIVTRSDITDEYHTDDISIHKLYTTDLDISAQWVISSIDKRIFLCDDEGEVRIYSYYRYLHRQPLLIERFHLLNVRLISSFTVTEDYLISYEMDTHYLCLYSHHGGLLTRLNFPSNPTMIIHSDYNQRKNQIWTCSRIKRKCYQFHLNHTMKQTNLLDKLDFTQPISNVSINPVGISSDERNRVAIHDGDQSTMDRLIIFTNQQNRIIPLDFLKNISQPYTSRIERILLVPKQLHLIVVLYTPDCSIVNTQEILIINISTQPVQILYRLVETNGIQNLDLTLNDELVYIVKGQTNKRTLPKMHIYSLFD